MNPPARLSTLDALRGIAALSVCWFHFTQGIPGFLPDGLLQSSGTYGWLGVEVFFVISGFIIPYALLRGGYRLANFGTFILKRVLRLDPPYLAAILLVIALGYASSATPGFQGPPFHCSWVQVLLHLGYLNVFFGYPWLNPVFWTLAIELQYYLLVGLLFPLIAHRAVSIRAGTFLFLAALALLVPAEQFLFHWLFLFMLGMVAFQFQAGLLARGPFLAGIALLGVGAWYVSDSLVALTGIGTALLIALFHSAPRQPLVFLGQISYSLYLLHVPIGGRVVNLSLRWVHTLPGKVGVLALALAASIVAAWVLYRCVEHPAQQWASHIRFRKKEIAAPAPAEEAAAS